MVAYGSHHILDHVLWPLMFLYFIFSSIYAFWIFLAIPKHATTVAIFYTAYTNYSLFKRIYDIDTDAWFLE
jgi:hypothetical protein